MDDIVPSSKRIRRYIRLAKREAQKSIFPKFRHGALLIKNGNVVSSSHNKLQHCHFLYKYRQTPGIPTKHAEIGCLLNQPRDLSGCVLFVLRINDKGELKNSKPCEMCVSFAKKMGIKKIFYSSSNQIIKRMVL